MMITKTIVCGIALFMGVLMAAPDMALAQCCGANRMGRPCGCKLQRNCGCNNDCQQCSQCNEEFCVLNCKQATEDRTCFEIDYKTICIPKVNPPWRRNCEPACAEARSVKILKQKTYQCPKCEYNWEVVQPELPQIIEPTPAQTQTQTPPIIPGNNESLSILKGIPRHTNRQSPDYYLPSESRSAPYGAIKPNIVQPTTVPGYQVPSPVNAKFERQGDQQPPIIRPNQLNNALPPIVRPNQPAGEYLKQSGRKN